MKKKQLILAFLVFASVSAWATVGTQKQIDTINATGGSALAVPSVGVNLLSDTSTATVTNKTISGASNTISNVSDSSLTGQVGVPHGGTGQSSLTSGNVLLGNGTSAVNFVAPGSSGNVLQSNGSTWTSAAPPAGAPTTNGTQASPQAVTAGGGVSLSGLSYQNVAVIEGSGGPVTVTATPSITACTALGQTVALLGENNTNTVTLQTEGNLSGSKLELNGNLTLGLNQMALLMCDGNGYWVEQSRAY